MSELNKPVYPSDSLSTDEIAKFRKLLESTDDLIKLVESDRRATWLWSTIRVWSLWVTGVVVATSVAWDALKRIVGAMK